MTGKSDFDLVIRRATIADGTGGPLYEGDVAIAGGLIAQVGKDIEQTRAAVTI